MHDGGKIIGGLAAFLVVAALPFWLNAAAGKRPRPSPKIVTQEKECVTDRATMRSSHMDLLNRWRDAVVREGDRTYVASSGRKHDMSLTRTCLSCHPNRTEFCDSCHNDLAVAPYCWDCHVTPKETT